MDLRGWLEQARHRLSKAGIESARLDAELLATHVLGAYRAWVLAHPDAEIDPAAAEPFLKRREEREPLAYILRWREFYGRRFAVGPGVLIPRQETELLVGTALDLCGSVPLRALDLGTGSGCIAITLKLERPEWTVIASDVSSEALDVARENRLALGADVLLLRMDALAALAPGSLDLIVCNPPYIAKGEPLMPEVADHEPLMALYAENGGLAFYERLAVEPSQGIPKTAVAPLGTLTSVGAGAQFAEGATGAPLRPGGSLILELGQGQAERVEAIFTSAGWRHVSTRPDLAGIPRVAVFALPD